VDKHELRARVRRQRAALGAGERTRAVRQAGDHLLAVPEVAAARRVLLYASHGDEVDTDRIVTSLVARGMEVLLPRVVDRRLELVHVGDLASLAAGFRGLREPTGPAVGSEGLDVAVVPGIAFDRLGGRLGQGGGHYDRLLAELPPAVVRIGLAFALQVVEAVPHETHDVPVDLLVTEEGPIRIASR
jgi:5-formyltetrahydrofolate cyclo-ligase